jgi:hypothetical protein
MVQRAAFAQRHADHVALGAFGRLADGFRHFARLAVTEADTALLVADDNERGETEAAATLDHLGNAVDVDELVDELAVCSRSRSRHALLAMVCSVLSGIR